MKVKDNLTFEEVNNLLNYNPDTGIFTWKIDRKNGTYKNDVAGTLKKDSGYIMISIYDIDYRAHRLAWLLYYKQWPNDEIDHINRNKKDNRICNLRDVNRTINQRNRIINNVSKCNGVIFEKDRRKWTARIWVNKKTIRIGKFDTMEEAILARKEAEKIYWG